MSLEFPSHLTQHTTMSDILKKFKSVFIVEDDTPPSTNPAVEKPEEPKNTQAKAPTAAVQGPSSGAVSKKFVDILASALEKNNQDGFDYFEFRQSLINLSKMQLDEPTRYQSAFAMAQTMGVTAPKLIESAQFYLSVLATEEQRFNEAHAVQRAKLIGSREEEAINLDNMIRQKTEQIKQLTREIGDHQKEVEQIRKQVGDATVKIENTKADFDTTFSSVVSQLQEDVLKIQQYLK